ncbi:MAG: cytochrome c3 family protein [Planctomycetota bacterium]
MSKIFTPRTRDHFRVALLGLTVIAVMATLLVWYYATPAYARVGYTPVQPVGFSHKVHAGDLAMDCRYCHNHVEESPRANIPSLQVCMNCHDAQLGNIKADAETLVPLLDAWKAGRTVEWVRVHKVPDFAYFSHAVHVRRGVSCVSCHGRVDLMEIVRHEESLTMAWCLDCHRDPAPDLRSADRVTDLAWEPEEGAGARILEEAGVRPPVDCSGCHR